MKHNAGVSVWVWLFVAASAAAIVYAAVLMPLNWHGFPERFLYGLALSEWVTLRYLLVTSR